MRCGRVRYASLGRGWDLIDARRRGGEDHALSHARPGRLMCVVSEAIDLREECGLITR